MVWAIDEAHAPLYFFPRDCPRVAFWSLPSSTAEDIERWMSDRQARMVICNEAAWLNRIQSTELYRYEFDGDGFRDCEDHGVHVAANAVRPLRMSALTDLPARIVAAAVELRYCQSLVPIGHAIQASTLHFSMIRMRNATGWEGPPSRVVGS